MKYEYIYDESLQKGRGPDKKPRKRRVDKYKGKDIYLDLKTDKHVIDGYPNTTFPSATQARDFLDKQSGGKIVSKISPLEKRVRSFLEEFEKYGTGPNERKTYNIKRKFPNLNQEQINKIESIAKEVWQKLELKPNYKMNEYTKILNETLGKYQGPGRIKPELTAKQEDQMLEEGLEKWRETRKPEVEKDPDAERDEQKERELD